MFADKYRDLMSSVARMADGDGGGEAPPVDDAAPAGDQTPPAGDDGAKPDAAAGDKQPTEAKPQRRSNEAVFQDRIGELTRHRREAERVAASERERAAKLESELRAAQELLQARGKGDGDDAARAPVDQRPPAPSSEEFERAVEERARVNARAAEITRRGDEIYDTAVKEFGQSKVDKALGNFKAFDGLRVELAEALFDLDDPAKVLYEIGSNPAEIDRLYKLADTNPVKMAVEVAKISARIAAKPVARKVSEAPEPPDIVNGRGSSGKSDWTDPNSSMEDFIKGREKHLKERNIRI
jgi:hypothetical protein